MVHFIWPVMTEIKIELKFFKSSEHIEEKGDGPYRVIGYSNSSVTLKIWQHGAKDNDCKCESFNWVVDTRR